MSYSDCMDWWERLSSLGSLGFTTLLALLVAAWLACAHCGRLAAAWLVLFAGALALAAMSQMAFIGWGIGINSLAFRGFSGHATRATAVFPVVLVVLLNSPRRACQWGAVLAGALFGTAVATARVKIGAHSPSEAVTGCLLGLATAISFVLYARAMRHDVPLLQLQPRQLILSCVLVAALFPLSATFESHRWLTAAALRLSGKVRTDHQERRLLCHRRCKGTADVRPVTDSPERDHRDVANLIFPL
jgi:membrane-associated phospholipid phosphatase